MFAAASDFMAWGLSWTAKFGFLIPRSRIKHCLKINQKCGTEMKLLMGATKEVTTWWVFGSKLVKADKGLTAGESD